MRWVCAFWLLTKIITYPLWTAYRLFPTIPVDEILYTIPPVVHLILFIASVICILLFITTANKKVAIALFFFEIASCLLDQNRWQPEIYLFLFLLFCYITVDNEQKRLLCWQIIIVSSYFFSGWFKWDPSFITTVWQRDLLRKFLHIYVQNATIIRLGYGIPICEMLLGVSLCFKAFKRVGLLFIILLHIFNLLWLGPLGLDSNIAVWPLNIIMPLLAINLFWNKNIDWPAFRKPYGILIITLVFWFILPSSNRFGYWDDFLSSEYYGGHTSFCYIDVELSQVPKALHPYFVKKLSVIENPDSVLSVQNWSYGEMNVPVYPSMRMYKKIAAQWQKRYGDSDKIFIIQAPYKKENVLYIGQ